MSEHTLTEWRPKTVLCTTGEGVYIVQYDTPHSSNSQRIDLTAQDALDLASKILEVVK